MRMYTVQTKKIYIKHSSVSGCRERDARAWRWGAEGGGGSVRMAQKGAPQNGVHTQDHQRASGGETKGKCCEVYGKKTKIRAWFGGRDGNEKERGGVGSDPRVSLFDPGRDSKKEPHALTTVPAATAAATAKTTTSDAEMETLRRAHAPGEQESSS